MDQSIVIGVLFDPVSVVGLEYLNIAIGFEHLLGGFEVIPFVGRMHVSRKQVHAFDLAEEVRKRNRGEAKFNAEFET